MNTDLSFIYKRKKNTKDLKERLSPDKDTLFFVLPCGLLLFKRISRYLSVFEKHGKNKNSDWYKYKQTNFRITGKSQ